MRRKNTEHVWSSSSTGGMAKGPEEALKAAMKISSPYMIKARVLVAGRGKAEGILFVESPSEVREKRLNFLTPKSRESRLKAFGSKRKFRLKGNFTLESRLTAPSELTWQ